MYTNPLLHLTIIIAVLIIATILTVRSSARAGRRPWTTLTFWLIFLVFVLAAAPFVPTDRGAVMYVLGLLVFAAVSFILAKIGAAIAAFIEGLLGRRHGA